MTAAPFVHNWKHLLELFAFYMPDMIINIQRYLVGKAK